MTVPAQRTAPDVGPVALRVLDELTAIRAVAEAVRAQQDRQETTHEHTARLKSERGGRPEEQLMLLLATRLTQCRSALNEAGALLRLGRVAEARQVITAVQPQMLHVASDAAPAGGLVLLP